MKNEIPISDVKGKVDFGIITIRQDEYDAVLKRFPHENIVRGRQIYSISRIQTTNDDEYLVASVRCPEQGNLQGQSVAQRLIEDLNPQWILVVGIAGAIPDYEYTLGDVLLSSRLHDFCLSASLEDGNQQTSQQFSVRGGAMLPEIQNLVAALPIIELELEEWNTTEQLTAERPNVELKPKAFYGNSDWKKKVKDSLNQYFGKNSVRQLPRAFSGSIASSDILVKNTQLAEQWLKSSKHINGIEMELAGVYQAGWDAHKPVLAIRGISDVVGFKRSPEWTNYACQTAASFAYALLRFRPIQPLSIKDDLDKKLKKKEIEASITSSLENHPVSVFKNKPPNFKPIEKPETLYSNLLEVSYFPDTLYSVGTICKDAKEIWGKLTEKQEEIPNDWVYKGKTIYSFGDFSDPIWQDICDGVAEPQSTSHWSESDNLNRKSEFIELLKNSLRELIKPLDLSYIHYKWFKGKKKYFKYICFAPTEDLSKRTITEKSLVQSSPRTVFKAYLSKKTGKISYYRHNAFNFDFVRYENKWFMEITPTYHFTWDGYRLSFYYEDLLSGIKRLEMNEAVFRQVLFWSEVLKGDKSEFLEQNRYPFLQFGNLLKYKLSYGVKDNLWTMKESMPKSDKKKSGRKNTYRKNKTSTLPFD